LDIIEVSEVFGPSPGASEVKLKLQLLSYTKNLPTKGQCQKLATAIVA